MELILQGIKRPFVIKYQNQEFDTVNEIPEGAQVRVVLPSTNPSTEPKYDPDRILTGSQVRLGKSYIIKVKKYMTQPSTPQFDFMKRWNNNEPMPFRVMVGRVVEETKGMVLMDLHCKPLETDYCMRCGLQLTNPVSRLYGLGPECGGHAYINPFSTEEQLYAALDEVQDKLANIKWYGWVIKSAIETAKEVQDGE